MKLKGDYNSGTSYSVGDVVRNSEGNFYYLVKPCAAGTTPTDSLYWNRLESPLCECAEMILNGVSIADADAEAKVSEVEAKIPDNISKDAISLFDGDTECIITVDASGETPELEVAVATEEGDET